MPASLFTYLTQTQRFIRDARMELIDPGDLISYINQARREVAMRAQCIRRLPLIYGSIIEIPIPPPPAGTIIYLRNPDGSLVLNPDGSPIIVSQTGGGWAAPVTVTISPPDSPSGTLPYPNGNQATAVATVANGNITDVEVTYGGDGYFQPQATFTDVDGNTATTTPVTTVLNTLKQGQEVYPFSGINLDVFPGVASVYAVRSVSIIYSNYRYSVPVYSFSTYQSQIRQFVASQYQYVPTFGAQFGRGAGGSFYLYPPPSQTYQLEFDCLCLPQDLVADESVEAIPDPWPDAVPYFAASLAFMELQSFNNARVLDDQFEKRMLNFGAYVLPGRVSNPYGRW